METLDQQKVFAMKLHRAYAIFAELLVEAKSYELRVDLHLNPRVEHLEYKPAVITVSTLL